ncbi:UNVERIFIED_CONTAM: hypothetical protein HHA_455100 [Hammondia hammondi]|eukprot:XP_008888879.1 hypothetical protein HHA_455100 [Hammondia hammondi]
MSSARPPGTAAPHSVRLLDSSPPRASPDSSTLRISPTVLRQRSHHASACTSLSLPPERESETNKHPAQKCQMTPLHRARLEQE